MPDDLEQLDDTGVTEDAGEVCAPVFDMGPVETVEQDEEFVFVKEVPVIPEPEPPPVVVEAVAPPPLQKFKVNARHSHSLNRWETVEATSEDEARRLFVARYGGEVAEVKLGEAGPRGKDKVNER